MRIHIHAYIYILYIYTYITYIYIYIHTCRSPNIVIYAEIDMYVNMHLSESWCTRELTVQGRLRKRFWPGADPLPAKLGGALRGTPPLEST